MSNETKAAPAVPQGWTDADSDAARLALELECLLLDTENLSVVSKWWASANEALELHRRRLATPAAPSQERCCTCGYLTSEREHLGCLRKAVKDLDAATGGPYPSQPVNRPQNCGTSFCSCIECVCEPSQPVTLTDGLIEKGAMTGMVDAQIDSIIAALREKEAKATP